MATFIGGVAASHTPTIGFAFDRDKRADPAWTAVFEAFDPVREYLDKEKPDVAILIHNDHVTSFFLGHYSAFTLGVGEEWRVADEGAGARDLPAIQGDPELAAHIGRSVMAEDFDLSFYQGRPLDHGVFSPLSMMVPHDADGWPLKLIPLQVGVLQFPTPTARRCYQLGAALRRAVESYPEDVRVAIIATGGLSHQVHGERSGFNNPEWDERFLDLFVNDPEAIAELTQAELAELGGAEGSEIVMWLVMRGALSAGIDVLHQAYTLPSMTGIATAVYQNHNAPFEQAIKRHQARAELQTAGAEGLDGTYAYTIERSVKAFRLNQFLHALIRPEKRAAFLADEETEFATAGLTEEERDLVRRRDWQGLIHYGVIFFMLEKLGAVIGVSNLHIYAAMRGETLEQFQATRNAQVLYSVAGKDSGTLDWDTKGEAPTTS